VSEPTGDSVWTDPLPGEEPAPPRPRPRRRRRRRWPGRAARWLVLALVFAAGLLLGDAFGDRPGPPRELTGIRGVRQVVVTQTVATRTVTVVVTGSGG
jgi:hypothetical protein